MNDRLRRRRLAKTRPMGATSSGLSLRSKRGALRRSATTGTLAPDWAARLWGTSHFNRYQRKPARWGTSSGLAQGWTRCSADAPQPNISTGLVEKNGELVAAKNPPRKRNIRDGQSLRRSVPLLESAAPGRYHRIWCLENRKLAVF
jgi:hypothetical protein